MLLLYSGRVVRGQVWESDDGYVVQGPIGELPFRRRDVERAFGSIREAYEYKRSRLPERDPDERMKLAQWCLEQKLYDEARAQLEAVLQLSPGLPWAKSMLFQHEASAQHPAPPKVDSALVRAAGERVEPEPPGTLPSDVLRKIREENRRTPVGLPVIFDLPPALAVKRYREFAAYVHPTLQRTCVSAITSVPPAAFS